MELRLGFQALALSAIVALGGKTSSVSAADASATIELDWSDETTAGMGHVTIHANDVLVLKGQETGWSFHGDGTTTKNWCKDTLPAIDVAQDVVCADGLKTCTEVWPGSTAAGTSVLSTDGQTITYGAAPENRTTAFLRVVPSTEPTINYIIDVTVLGANEQSSAFSAAYAAGTFVASSMLVAAIALF